MISYSQNILRNNKNRYRITETPESFGELMTLRVSKIATIMRNLSFENLSSVFYNSLN